MDMRDLIPYGIAFVVLAVTLSVGANIVGTLTLDNTVQEANTTANNGLAALVTLSSWQNIIAITLAAAVIIGGLLLYFRFN
jgi:transcriptional regulator with GAF, ATPase, and Fis domain|tara:strand:+ start:202 stop:444 length:243 start_codon:yes stop_codon:yes gene_type:complete